MARFVQKGNTKAWWVPTIASPALIPTTAEVTAGTDLTPQISDIAGFTFDNTPVDTPDMGQALVTKIPGEDVMPDSTMTFYEDKTTNPIKTLLAKGVNGYVVIFGTGIAGAAPAAADKADVWPSQVASNARQYHAGNEASKYLVKFTPTKAPATAVTLT